jgi:hypothetical protein
VWQTARGYRTETIRRAPLLTVIGWTEASKQEKLYRCGEVAIVINSGKTIRAQQCGIVESAM